MPASAPISLALLAYDGANAVDVFGPLQVFQSANSFTQSLLDRAPAGYKTQLVSVGEQDIRLATQTRVISDATLATASKRKLHTLLIAGGSPARQLAEDASLIKRLQALDRKTQRSASVCSGAFILAATGALNGRRATTHWNRAEEFRQRFPQVFLDVDSIFTQDGKYACSAGVTAGIDLALHMVQNDYGRRVALATAREMVTYIQRPGGQSQFSHSHGCPRAKSEPLLRAQEWLHQHLDQNLEVARLAELAHMSTRHFSRRFHSETGLSPARYIAQARLNQARLLLEENTDSIAQVAKRTGYNDPEIMRRQFIRALNTCPSEYRQRFSSASTGR